MEMREVKRFPHIGKWLGGAIVALAVFVPCARADYMVLQSGQRIHVTGYERLGDTLRLTMTGGNLEIPGPRLPGLVAAHHLPIPNARPMEDAVLPDAPRVVAAARRVLQGTRA